MIMTRSLKMLNGDKIEISCYDWSKEISKIQGRIDELTMGISTKEYGEWLNVNSN